MSKARYKAVSISLHVDDLAVIDEFAQLAGMTRSAVVQGFIREALPTLQTVGNTLRELHELDAAQRAEILQRFKELEADAENLKGEAGAVARAALAAIHEAKFSKV